MNLFKDLLLTDIEIDSNQPRKHFAIDSLQELTQSVIEKGVIQPVLVRIINEKYILVCGERRYRAATAAALLDSTKNTIPAIIKSLTDSEALELQIIENLQRKDVHPMEEAIAFKALVYGNKLMTVEIGARIGKTEYFVRQRIKLNDLLAEWQTLFLKDHITLTLALKIAQLLKADQRILHTNNVSAKHLENPSFTVEVNAYQFNQFVGKLSMANFDLADKTISAKVGSCIGCSFNTHTAQLFKEDIKDATCLNTSCFIDKQDIYFNSQLAIAKEDPTIILINNSYQNSKVASELKSTGTAVLKKYDDFDTVHAPELISKEEFNENWDDYNQGTAEELQTAWETEVAEFDEKSTEYNTNIDNGSYIKAFSVDGDKVGQYSYIQLRKGASENADITKEDIEVLRLRKNEVRAKELDAEKVHAIVQTLLIASPKFTQEREDFTLTQNEIIGAVVTLFELGTYNFRKWFQTRFDTASHYSFALADMEKFANFTHVQLNEILLKLLVEKLTAIIDPKAPASVIVRNIATDYHSQEVGFATIEQNEKAFARQEKLLKRISKLTEPKEVTEEV